MRLEQTFVVVRNQLQYSSILRHHTLSSTNSTSPLLSRDASLGLRGRGRRDGDREDELLSGDAGVGTTMGGGGGRGGVVAASAPAVRGVRG